MAIFVSDNNSQSDSSPTIKDSGSPAGSAGSTGTPAGLPEPASDTPHPIANRDVEITIPSENRFLIDWASFTFKLDDPYGAAGIIGLDRELFTPFDFGFSGYKSSLRYGNISIYFEGRADMGCHVEFSGQGCRQFEGHFTEPPWLDLFQTVLANNGKFSRLDLAIDNVDGQLTLDRVWQAIQDHDNQIRTQFGEWRRIQKGSFQTGEQITGDTIYLGSSKSHIQFRIYDKAQESGVAGHWIRFELQLRDKRAHEAAKLFAAGEPIGTLTTGIINNYFSIINDDDSNKSRCTLQAWWSEWLQATDRIRLTTQQSIRLVSDTMEFIRKQYAPSVAMINQYLGNDSFKSFINNVLEDGKERMTAKHDRILAASETKGRRT